MKRKEKPTAYIYIKTFTQSEWDSCDFGIVKITADWIKLLAERLELLEPFRERSDFYSHEYWDTSCSYFVNRDESDVLVAKDENEDWCFIETTPLELKKLPQPESALVTHQLVITGDGFGYFTSLGKHSDEEYFSAEFNLAQLIDAVNLNIEK